MTQQSTSPQLYAGFPFRPVENGVDGTTPARPPTATPPDPLQTQAQPIPLPMPSLYFPCSLQAAGRPRPWQWNNASGFAFPAISSFAGCKSRRAFSRKLRTPLQAIAFLAARTKFRRDFDAQHPGVDSRGERPERRLWRMAIHQAPKPAKAKTGASRHLPEPLSTQLVHAANRLGQPILGRAKPILLIL